jgi:hypothetical protein
MANEAWLDGICDYTGPGSDLPVGGYCKIPGWYPEMMAKAWTVLDAESEEGVKYKMTKELKPTDIIIGVTFNPKSVEAIAGQYGKDFFKVTGANGGALMTLDEWEAKFDTNAMGLVAIRNMRKKLSGGGIKF